MTIKSKIKDQKSKTEIKNSFAFITFNFLFGYLIFDF